MLRAVPSTIRMAASMSLALRSFIFVSAIWRTWDRLSVPTFWRIWAGLPFSSPAAFLIRSDAGGVLRAKVNDRSSKTMISTGMMLPAWEEVRSLYSLQKAMMLAPCWPSAGPTGGAGVALPASSWSLMTARIFFATALEPLHLEEVQLHGGLADEEGDQHAHLALFDVDLVHGANEVHEGTVGDADALAELEADLDARLFGPHLAEDGEHLRLLQRRWRGAGADEAGYAGRVAHDGPGLAGQRLLLLRGRRVVLPHLHHLDQDVAGEDLAGDRAPHPIADLDLVDGGDDDVEDEVFRVHGLDALLKVGAGLVLVPGVGVDDVPGAARQEHLLVGDDRSPGSRRLGRCREVRGPLLRGLLYRGLCAFLPSRHPIPTLSAGACYR